jgi:hypothetical protein
MSDRRERNRGILVLVMAVVIAAIAALVITLASCSDGQEPEGGSTEDPLVGQITPTVVPTIEPTPVSTLVPTPLPMPVLKNNYQVGEVLKVGSTYRPCMIVGDHYTADCYEDLHLWEGNVVEIIGPPTIMDRDEERGFVGRWGRHVNILQGSYYMEGKEVWVDDRAFLHKTTLGERPVPELDIVNHAFLVNYSFVVASYPGGPPAAFDQYGNELWVYGGDRVTILTGPTMSWDGHYWCEIQTTDYKIGVDPISEDILYLEGWIPCEFRRAWY